MVTGKKIKPSKIKQIIQSILVLVITIAILAAILHKIDFKAVIRTLKEIKSLPILFALFLQILSLCLRTIRWRTILATDGFRVAFTKVMTIILAAAPLSSLTPAKAGDVSRAVYLRKEIPVATTVGSILTERVFDILFLFIYSLIGIVVLGKWQFLPALSVVAFAMLIGFLLLLLFFKSQTQHFPTISEKLARGISSLKKLILRKDYLLVVSGLSGGVWFIALLQVFIFFIAIGIEAPLLSLFVGVPLAILIGTIPVTLGGVGTRDAAIILMFAEFASSAQLLGVGILFTLVRYVFPAILGIPFFVFLTSKKSEKDPS